MANVKNHKAKKLLKEARTIKRSMEGLIADRYYRLEYELRNKLCEVLDCDLSTLSKNQLFELLSYCSTHRPKELYRILMDFASHHKGVQDARHL